MIERESIWNSSVSPTIIADLPPLPEGFSYRLDLASAAIPRLLRKRPVHRWFWFPHSYSPELVEAILDAWKLPLGSAILDPFVGAGTTLVVAKERGYAAMGVDLSPLAALVSHVKVSTYDPKLLEEILNDLRQRWEEGKDKKKIITTWITSERLRRAFTSAELNVLTRLREEILRIEDQRMRDFFLLVLLSILPEFSRAVADGGWFRWIERPDRSINIAPRMWEKAKEMIEDMCLFCGEGMQEPEIRILDARSLQCLAPYQFDALITSPPYLNRHDYSRIFQIELLMMGQQEENIKKLRYWSLRSHVEAKPLENKPEHYIIPPLLAQRLDWLPKNIDRRLRPTIEGYFEDMFLVLHSAKKILKSGAKVALVVGNVRYFGILFPVDEILITLGEQAGYRHFGSWVIRLRGNSAQQMGKFGRMPSRETIVMLESI